MINVPIPFNKKTAPFIYLAIAAIIAILLISAIKGLKNLLGNGSPSGSELGKDGVAENKSQTASYSPSQYGLMADVIYNSLRSSMVDDDKPAAVAQMLKVNNNRDVAELIKAYGDRQRYFFGLPDGGKTNLFETLIDELNASQLKQVNNHFTIKGISYQL